MTASGTTGVVDGVDVDRVAAVVLRCPGVVALEDTAAGPTRGPVRSYVPGRVIAGVRVDSDRVLAQVVAEWTVPVPRLGRRIQAEVAPLAGGRRVDVIVADLADIPGQAGRSSSDEG